MDQNPVNPNQPGSSNAVKITGIVVVGVILVLLIAGGIVYMLAKQAAPKVEVNAPANSGENTGASVEVQSGVGTVKVTGGNTVPVPSIRLSSISPASGSIGTMITIKGSGFSLRGNSIIVNKGVNGYINNVDTSDGATIVIKVPSLILVDGVPAPVEPGIYNVSIRNALGKVSNSLIFAVSN